MRVLLVEPDEYYHSAMRESLADLAELSVVRRAELVLPRLTEVQPDVLIMELLLPDASGYELLEQIRGSTKDMPIIIFSKVDHIDDIAAALNYGVSAFFVKGKDTTNEIRRLLLTYSSQA